MLQVAASQLTRLQIYSTSVQSGLKLKTWVPRILQAALAECSISRPAAAAAAA